MNILICLDDKNGLLFNNRRLSRDRVLNKEITEISKGKALWMNEYSSKLFEKEKICVHEAFWEKAEKGDFCFFENNPTQSTIDKAEIIYVFLWNRHYPADIYFDYDLEKEGFSLSETKEFAGSSHEKITLNIWRRK